VWGAVAERSALHGLCGVWCLVAPEMLWFESVGDG